VTGCVDLLRAYVATPSVNPMGRSDIPDSYTGERRYAELVQTQLRAIGLDAVLVGEGERPSVVAEACTAGARETVLIASHLDTVPVDEMEIDPFDPQVSDGRLYGRGSCDTKAGMAALVDALAQVLARGTLRRNVIVVGEADEELASVGVRDVLAHLGGRRPDWALATEPTELRVVTHHKGIAVARLEARGVACHSSDPGAGRSAITTLARAVLALGDLHEALARRRDPMLGPGTCSVGVIGGGKAPNVVPDAAWLLMDRRLLPGETAEQVQREIEAALAGASVQDVHVTACVLGKPPLGTDPGSSAVRACQSALRACGLPSDPGTVAFGTDAALFADAGIPGVVLGPGSVAQAHTAREFVEVAQVEAMTRLFVRLLEAQA
jgi:acetylornithine deacetylase